MGRKKESNKKESNTDSSRERQRESGAIPFYGCQPGRVACGYGVVGVGCLAVGATGFVHAIIASRIVTQIMERYFIKPPFLNTDSSLS